jgi:hypothetical protein
MKKYLVMPAALAATALSLTACGAANHSTAATKVASGQPVATHSAKKTDMPLCTTLKTELTAFSNDAKSMTNMSDAAVESYIPRTLLPELQHIQAGAAQLASEATVASDSQRIAAVQKGLSTIYGGLTDLTAGDTTGISMLSQGMGQISAATGANALTICGSQPTGA